MFKLIKDRWTSSTPKFFKRIITGGSSVGAFGLACIPFSSNLPTKLQAIPGYLIAVGLATAGVAKMTKQDGGDQFLNSGSTPSQVATTPPASVDPTVTKE